MRRRLLPLAALVSLIATVAAAPAAPATMTLTQRNDAGRVLSWSGTVERPATAPIIDAHAGIAGVPKGADERTFVTRLGDAKTARVTTYVTWESAEDLAVTVEDADGNAVDSTDSPPGQNEIMTYDVENGRAYTVTVSGRISANTSYSAYTWVRSVSGRNYRGPNKLRYASKEILATIDVPINIVFAGFDKAEVEANRARVLDQIPPAFRPAVRIGANAGGMGLTRRDAGRREAAAVDHAAGGPLIGAEGSDVWFEPIMYRYRPRIVTASDQWTQKLFAAAKAATTSGDFELPYDREYLERYNARFGALRGPGSTVAPNSPVDFVDAMKVEDWVAKNPPVPGMSFDLRKPAAGYTYFVINSHQPAYASKYFNPLRYHNFRIMNSLTVDPDSGLQSGVDWARVWGGRYRFLMLDVGAAPNSWEVDAAAANVRNFRLPGNGDSSKHDPPIWHYYDATTGAPALRRAEDFYSRIGENVQQAIWFRFTRGYLYRPRAYEKYILAGNTWHDADAYKPWPSQLDKLYKDKFVLARYKELIPYAQWSGFSSFKYLSKGDPEQKALDAGKNRTGDGVVAPAAVSYRPMMDLINRNRARYAPVEPGAFTVPVVNVVFPSLYTFAGLPAVTGGVAVGEDGEPWGQIQNVNDRTKTYNATGTVKDSSGMTHAPVAADARKNANETVPGGIDNVGRFGFTAVALHEAGHFFGLSHTHDAIAYDWKLSKEAADPSKPNGYYSTIDWMYTTTASPMGYGLSYNRFEVLDKDNIWIGHAAEWLAEAQENLAGAYAALDAKGHPKVTTAVANAKVATERVMAQSVAALKGGRYLDAVKLALAAKKSSLGTLVVAARTGSHKGHHHHHAHSASTSAAASKATASTATASVATAPAGAGVPLLPIAGLALGASLTIRSARRQKRPAAVRIRPPIHRD